MTPSPPVPRLLRLLRGIALVCVFRAEGFALLGGQVADVLASLAPLLAFPLALGLLVVMAGIPSALALPLAAIGAALAPLAVSEALCRAWKREAEWGWFAAAYNWCQWPLGLVAMLTLAASLALARLGVDADLTSLGALAVTAVYQFSLHWFLARRGLALSRTRAALLVLLADLAAIVIMGAFMWIYGVNPQSAGANGSAS